MADRNSSPPAQRKRGRPLSTASMTANDPTAQRRERDRLRKRRYRIAQRDAQALVDQNPPPSLTPAQERLLNHIIPPPDIQPLPDTDPRLGLRISGANLELPRDPNESTYQSSLEPVAEGTERDTVNISPTRSFNGVDDIDDLIPSGSEDQREEADYTSRPGGEKNDGFSLTTGRQSVLDSNAGPSRSRDLPSRPQTATRRWSGEKNGGLDDLSPREEHAGIGRVAGQDIDPPIAEARYVDLFSALDALDQNIDAQIQEVRALDTPTQNTTGPNFIDLRETDETSILNDDNDAQGADTDDDVVDQDDEERHPREIVAQRLIDHLQGQGLGCSTHQHRVELVKHRRNVKRDGSRCTDLATVFNDDTFPSVIEETYALLPREQYQSIVPPTLEQWNEMFCGTDGEDPPLYVCLHATETSEVEVEIAFDVDSYLGFASSLAFAKRGIQYQPAPQYRQNIQTDVHLKARVRSNYNDTDSDDDDDDDEGARTRRTRAANLKDVPHFMLGTLAGEDHVEVFVLFPEIGFAGKMFHALTQDQHRKWMDMIFLPSIEEYLPAHYTQHLPGNYRHANLNSYARRTEGRSAETGSYASQQALSYFLPPDSLDDIWAAVERRIRILPEARIFQNAQLFFSAKGTKLRYKERTGGANLLRTLESFLEAFERDIDVNYIYPDRVYADVGKEVCPLASRPGRPNDRVEAREPHVLLWRRCCLERILNTLWDRTRDRDELLTTTRFNKQFYSVSMLHDAANCTSAPPQKSELFQGGLVYMQFYSSVKEVIDAAKQYPFQNDSIEEMALDPLVHKAALSATKNKKRDLRVVEKAYLASKHRLHEAILGSERKSFGNREEFRETLRLIQEQIAILRSEGATRNDNVDHGDNRLPVRQSRHPSTMWAIPTSTYLNFLRRNADKFATGFELTQARARGAQNRISWEHTKTIAMFLRCLQYCLSGHNLAREGALWWGTAVARDEETQRRVRRVGLGFMNTLARYGYAWMEPRINWATLTFYPEVTDHVMFGNTMLKRSYTRHGGSVQDFFDATKQMETAIGYLHELRKFPEARGQVMEWLMHIVLRQFRIDVLSSIGNDLADDCQVGERKEEILKGDQPFSHSYISEICRPERMVVMRAQKANRNTPRKLLEFLLAWDDGTKRMFWEHLRFRVMHRQCCEDLEAFDPEVSEQWQEMVFAGFLRWHWMLPYPHNRGLMETNKVKQRKWFSVDLKRDRWGIPSNMLQVGDWRMVSQDWRRGRPEPLPDWLAWDRADWENWKLQWVVGTT